MYMFVLVGGLGEFEGDCLVLSSGWWDFGFWIFVVFLCLIRCWMWSVGSLVLRMSMVLFVCCVGSVVLVLMRWCVIYFGGLCCGGAAPTCSWLMGFGCTSMSVRILSMLCLSAILFMIWLFMIRLGSVFWSSFLVWLSSGCGRRVFVALFICSRTTLIWWVIFMVVMRTIL